MQNFSRYIHLFLSGITGGKDILGGFISGGGGVLEQFHAAGSILPHTAAIQQKYCHFADGFY